MRSIGFNAAWLASEKNKSAVVQCGEIGHSHNCSSADASDAKQFVERPDPVLQMFQDLIGNNDVKEIRAERQARRFQIQRAGMNTSSSGRRGEAFRAFDAV